MYISAKLKLVNPWDSFAFLFVAADYFFFNFNFFEKFFQEYHHSVQQFGPTKGPKTDWIGYQRTILVGKELNDVHRYTQ